MHTNETTPIAIPAVANVSNDKPAPVAKPAKAKRAPKPASAKPPKPAKPAADQQRNADRERAQANRAIVRPHYAGPSPVSHASVAPKLADALSRVANPIQRAKSPTTRDDSALALALKHSDRQQTFCPVAATADLGALSRLASLGFLTVRGNRIALTKTGAERARNIAKRA